MELTSHLRNSTAACASMPTTAASLDNIGKLSDLALALGHRRCFTWGSAANWARATMQLAMLPKWCGEEFPDRIIEVMDGQLVTISQGFGMAAARAAAGGRSLFGVMQVTREASQACWLSRYAGNAGIPGTRRAHRQSRLYVGKH